MTTVNATDVIDGFENQKQINDKTNHFFSSMHDLLTTEPRMKGQLVTLLSYHEGLNVGGGYFVALQSNILIEDGVTVFKSKAIGFDDYFWVRINILTITPEMAGSIGDGIADDTESFIKFAECEYKHKEAHNDYVLTKTAVFTVNHQNSVIDCSQSRIFGTNFYNTPIQILIKEPIQTLKVKGGSYDGLEVVNGYLEIISTENGYADIIELECFGVVKNFSNSKNTRSCFGYRVNVFSRIIKVLNPIVGNVYNLNGISGLASAAGIVISNFTEQGIVENPIINGIFTKNVDADGIVLFEAKGIATTGTAIAIVRNANISQTFGRAIKSQCTLHVSDTRIKLISSPEKGLIIENWRGIDAQLGNLIARNIGFDLRGGSLFTSTGDNCLYVINGSSDNGGDQLIHNTIVSGGSNIRHAVLINSKDMKSISIDNFQLLEEHPTLNLLYIIAEVQVSNLVSIKNVSGGWSISSRLIFTALLNRFCENLVLENIAWTGYPVFDVDHFQKLRIISVPKITCRGQLAYSAIDLASTFYYANETPASGGLTYNNPNVPSWAKRDIHYERGVVYSTFRNNVLIPIANKFYLSTQSPPQEIV
ncbi:hypothetical protein [Acinetobacter gyllenbergii]|uniref:hypothetical protein n=1 Tax=Acinetobacter gyllenbergii TaxID=134534 RepID=UPI003F56F076